MPWVSSSTGLRHVPASVTMFTMRTPEDPLHPSLHGLGARVRFARERAGLSVNELARRSGLDSGRISRLQVEDRVQKLSVNTVAEVAYALGVRLGWLLTGEEPIAGKMPAAALAQAPAMKPPVFTEQGTASLKRYELLDRMLKLLEEEEAPAAAASQGKR